MAGAILIAGASSGAGKSTVASALCRALVRRGFDVAPFKAQNMSNHSAVTPDGGEIGRAQAMQALAARCETDRRMGPVLLKPSGLRSHVVVLGDEVAVDDAVSYGQRARSLRPVVLEALTGLRRDHQMVVMEGAGGAAEPNLLDRDIVNMPLAAAAGIPAVLVVDIDRGGAFASAYGTWALLPERLRSQLHGVILNGMRGDVSLLDPAIADLEQRTGMPVLGVLPHLGEHLMLGVEDSMDLRAPGRLSPAEGWFADRPVRVAAVRLPHLANPSDLDPLALEPSVELRWATRPGDLSDVDLVIIPGTRATVADLAWLRERGLDTMLERLVASPVGPHVLGICGGYQMLGTTIQDDVESGAGTVAGLGLLPVSTTFATPKVVRRDTGRTANRVGLPVRGYQVRLGRMTPDDGVEAWLELAGDGEGGKDEGWIPEGCLRDDRRVRGTSLHGVLDSDELRQALLGAVAAVRGRTFTAATRPYEQALQDHLDHLGDWVEQHLDMEALLALAGTADHPDAAPGW